MTLWAAGLAGLNRCRQVSSMFASISTPRRFLKANESTASGTFPSALVPRRTPLLSPGLAPSQRVHAQVQFVEIRGSKRTHRQARAALQEAAVQDVAGEDLRGVQGRQQELGQTLVHGHHTQLPDLGWQAFEADSQV